MPNKVEIINAKGKQISLDASDFSKNYQSYVKYSPGAKVVMYDNQGKTTQVALGEALGKYRAGYSYSAPDSTSAVTGNKQAEGTQNSTAQQALQAVQGRFGTQKAEQPKPLAMPEGFGQMSADVALNPFGGGGQKVETTSANADGTIKMPKGVEKQPDKVVGKTEGMPALVDNPNSVKTKYKAVQADIAGRVVTEEAVNTVVDVLTKQTEANAGTAFGDDMKTALGNFDAHGGTTFMALRKYNESISPEELKAKIQNENFIQDSLAPAVYNSIFEYNANGQIVGYKKNITDKANELGISEQQFVQENVLPNMVSQAMARVDAREDQKNEIKGIGDYLLAKLGNSFIGQTMALSTKTRAQRQSRAQALGTYEQQQLTEGGVKNLVARIGGEAVGAMGDAPLFMLGGEAGKGASAVVGKAWNAIGKEYAGTAFGAFAKTIAPLAEKVGGRALTRYEQIVASNMPKIQQLVRGFARTVPNSVANMSTFMGSKGGMNEIYGGDDTSLTSVLKAIGSGMKEGAEFGLVMSATGVPMNVLKMNASLGTTKAFIGATGKAMELGSMVGLDWVKEGDDFNFTDSTLRNLTMLIGMHYGAKPLHTVGSAVDAVLHPWKTAKAKWASMMSNDGHLRYKFTDAEKAELQRALPGMDIYDLGNMDISERYKRDSKGILVRGADGIPEKEYIDKDGKVIGDKDNDPARNMLFNKMSEIFGNPNISWETKQKISGGMFQTVETARPRMTDWKVLDGNRVEFRDKDGNLIAVREFKNNDECLSAIDTERVRNSFMDLNNNLNVLAVCGDRIPVTLKEVKNGLFNDFGIEEKDLVNILLKDFRKLNEKEREIVRSANKRCMEAIEVANEGILSPEFSRQNGERLAQEGNMVEGSQEAVDVKDYLQKRVADTENDLSNRKAEAQDFLDKYSLEVNLDELTLEDVKNLANQVPNPDELNVLLEYVKSRNNRDNAQMTWDSYINEQGKHIQQSVDLEYAEVSHRGKVDGNDTNGKFIIGVTDKDGKRYYLIDSDVDSTTSKVLSESGMSIVQDAETGEMKFVNSDELSYSPEMSVSEDAYKNYRVNQLGTDITAKYNLMPYEAQRAPEEARQQDTTSQNTTTGEQTTEQPQKAVLDTIPHTGGEIVNGKKKEVKYDFNSAEVTPEQRVGALMEMLGNEEAVKRLVNANVKKHEDALKKLNKQIEGETDANKLPDEIAKRDEAQRLYDAWKASADMFKEAEKVVEEAESNESANTQQAASQDTYDGIWEHTHVTNKGRTVKDKTYISSDSTDADGTRTIKFGVEREDSAKEGTRKYDGKGVIHIGKNDDIIDKVATGKLGYRNNYGSPISDEDALEYYNDSAEKHGYNPITKKTDDTYHIKKIVVEPNGTVHAIAVDGDVEMHLILKRNPIDDAPGGSSKSAEEKPTTTQNGIPLDENGNAVLEPWTASADKALEYLQDEIGLTREQTDEFLNGKMEQVKKAETALKARDTKQTNKENALKEPNVPMDVNDLVGWRKKQSEAQAEYEKNKAELEQERNAIESQRAILEERKAYLQSIADANTAKFDAERIAKERLMDDLGLPNHEFTEEEILDNIPDDRIKEVVKNPSKYFEPETPEDAVNMALAGMMKTQGWGITPQSLMKWNINPSDVKKLYLQGLIVKKENGGQSIDQIAHDMYENWGDMPNIQSQIAMEDVPQLIYDAIMSGNPRSYIADKVRREYEKEIADSRADLERKRDEFFEEEYGLTYDEYVDWAYDRFDKITKENNDIPREEIDRIFAEETETTNTEGNDNEGTDRERGGEEKSPEHEGKESENAEGNTVLQEAQPDDTTGTEVGTDDRGQVQDGRGSDTEDGTVPEGTSVNDGGGLEGAEHKVGDRVTFNGENTIIVGIDEDGTIRMKRDVPERPKSINDRIQMSVTQNGNYKIGDIKGEDAMSERLSASYDDRRLIADFDELESGKVFEGQYLIVSKGSDTDGFKFVHARHMIGGKERSIIIRSIPGRNGDCFTLYFNRNLSKTDGEMIMKALAKSNDKFVNARDIEAKAENFAREIDAFLKQGEDEILTWNPNKKKTVEAKTEADTSETVADETVATEEPKSAEETKPTNEGIGIYNDWKEFVKNVGEIKDRRTKEYKERGRLIGEMNNKLEEWAKKASQEELDEAYVAIAGEGSSMMATILWDEKQNRIKAEKAKTETPVADEEKVDEENINNGKTLADTALKTAGTDAFKDNIGKFNEWMKNADINELVAVLRDFKHTAIQYRINDELNQRRQAKWDAWMALPPQERYKDWDDARLEEERVDVQEGIDKTQKELDDWTQKREKYQAELDDAENNLDKYKGDLKRAKGVALNELDKLQLSKGTDKKVNAKLEKLGTLDGASSKSIKSSIRNFRDYLVELYEDIEDLIERIPDGEMADDLDLLGSYPDGFIETLGSWDEEITGERDKEDKQALWDDAVDNLNAFLDDEAEESLIRTVRAAEKLRELGEEGLDEILKDYELAKEQIAKSEDALKGNPAEIKSIDEIEAESRQMLEDSKKLLDEITGEQKRRSGEGENDTEIDHEAERNAIIEKAKADGTYMKAPNGKPTKLNEKQWAEVRTESFKKWFGDWEKDPENASKVVDENGEPLVVYHGSPYGGIEEFDRNKGLSSGLKEFGTYFTTNKELAELYMKGRKLPEDIISEIDTQIEVARGMLDESRNNYQYDSTLAEIERLKALKEGRVYECYLNIRNPKEFDAKNQDGWNGWHELRQDVGYDVKVGIEAIEAISGNNPAATMKEKYDGIIAHNIADIHGSFDEKLAGDAILVFDQDANKIKSATDNNGDFDNDNPNIRFREKEGRGANRAVAQSDIDHAQKLVDTLGGNGKVVTKVDDISNPSLKKKIESGANISGEYNPKTGEVEIYLPNCEDSRDVETTVFHEKVGHEGLRKVVGEKNWQNFLHQVFRGMSKADKKAIIDKANKKGWNFDVAIDEHLAEMAEDVRNHAEVDTAWQKIKNVWNTMLRKLGFKNSMTENDIRQAIWLSKNALENKTGSLEYMAKKKAFEYKLSKRVPKEKMSEDKSKFEGKNKNINSPMGTSDRSIYDNGVNSIGFLWTEAHQNALRSLQLAQEAVMGEGNAIKDSENAFMALNRLPSTDQTAMEEFKAKYSEPFTEHLRELMSKFDGETLEERYENLEKYLIAKHGLERNRVFFVRDVTGKLVKSDEPADKALGEQIRTDFLAERKRLKTELDNGTIGIDEYYRQLDEWIRNKVDSNYDASKMDKSGLSDAEGFKEWADGNGVYDESKVLDYIKVCENKMGKADVDKLWNEIKDINNYTIDKQYESGMSTTGQKNRAKEMFDWYIPLRGFDADTAEDLWNYIGREGKPSVIGMRTADHRITRAKNPISTMIVMANGAIMQGNRNLAKMHLFRLVQNNANPLFTEMNLYYEKKTAPNGEEYLEPIYPTLREGMTGEEMNKAMENYNAAIDRMKESGAEIVKDTKSHGDLEIKFERDSDAEQHMIHVMVGGKRRTLFVNGNPRVAQAVNGMIKDKNAHWIKSVNNFMSQMATSKSATFILRNGTRDFEYATATLAAVEGKGYVTELANNYRKLSPTGKNEHSMLSLFKRYRLTDKANEWLDKYSTYDAYLKDNPNVTEEEYLKEKKNYEENRLDMSNDIDKKFSEFVKNGGMTGYVQMGNVEEMQREMESMLKKGKITGLPSGNKLFELGGKIGDGFEKVWFSHIETLNEAVENQTRFAVYLTSRTMKNRTVARSIYDAKNAGVNFNLSGAGFGTNSMKTKNESTWHQYNRMAASYSATFLRNAVIFYNAGIQGMSRTAQVTFGGDKKQMLKAIGSVAAVPMAMGMLAPAWNQLATLGDTDEDRAKFGDNPYAQLPEYERRQNLCLYVGHGRFVKIPLAIELRAFYGLGDLAAGAMGRYGGYKWAKGLDGEGVVNPESKLSVAGNYGYGLVKELAQITPVDIFGGSKAVHDSWWGGVLGITIPSAAAPFFAAGLAGIGGIHGSNVGWTGSPISHRADYNSNQAEWKKAATKTPRALVSVTKWLSDITGGDEVKGGWLDINPSELQYIADQYGAGAFKDLTTTASGLFNSLLIGFDYATKHETDRQFNVGDLPVAKAFFRSRTTSNALSVARTRYYNYIKESGETNKDMANYKSEATKSIEGQASYIKFMNSPAVMRAQVLKQYQNEIKKMQKAKNEATSRSDRDVYQEQINMLMDEAVRKMDLIEDMRKSGQLFQ